MLGTKRLASLWATFYIGFQIVPCTFVLKKYPKYIGNSTKTAILMKAPPGGQVWLIKVVRGMILIGFAFCFTKFYRLVQKLWQNYIFPDSEEQ